MKQFLYILGFLVANTIFAQNYHDTQGKLEITNSGQATYTLPIAMPPSLNNVGPVINVVYASGQQGGIAGQGWNISTVSSINRMATRKDIDGFVDGVDFDDNDKLALDGQRLILKTGTYWADGSTYVTEVQSNTKIELKGSGDAIYFIVTTPDGSRTWYGSYGSNPPIGAAGRDKTAYYIMRFEDAEGNYITYDYRYPISNNLLLWEITFSANTNGISPVNSIKFNYKAASRVESAYLKGEQIQKSALLDYIEVKTGGQLFKKYQLTHTPDSFGYDRVTKIQEFNGAGEAANPVIFDYNNTPNTVSETGRNYDLNFDFNDADATGDFDGDGKVDFIKNDKLYLGLFKEGTGVSAMTVPTSGFKFTATTLKNNILNQKQSLVKPIVTLDQITFDVYTMTDDNTALTYQYSKNLPFNNKKEGSFCPYIINPEVKISNKKEYLEGDFNGDGISEVLILSTAEYSKTWEPGRGQPCRNVSSDGITTTYWVDLNQNASTVTDSNGFAFLSNLFEKGTKKTVADFNGDGKSDIIEINDITKKYKIVSLEQNATTGLVSVITIGEGTFPDYDVLNKTVLFGDFNGDAKTDLMIPQKDGKTTANISNLWTVYYANPKPAGGSFFETEVQKIVNYFAPYANPDNYTYYSQYKYFAMDINKDGKSDLLLVDTYVSPQGCCPNDMDNEWTMTTFINKKGMGIAPNTSVESYNCKREREDHGWREYDCSYRTLTTSYNDFQQDYQSGKHYSTWRDNPSPIVANFRYAGMNSELVMVYKGYNFLNYISFNKDVTQDNQLIKVTASGGNMVDNITYQLADQDNITKVCTSYRDWNSSANYPPLITTCNLVSTTKSPYSSSTVSNLPYPFLGLKKLPNAYLVSGLSNTSEGVTRYQDYKYRDFVVHLGGLGAIGFTKTARTAWYTFEPDNSVVGGIKAPIKTWSVTENNPLLRGATVRTYSQLVPANTAFSFVETGNPTGIINSTTHLYEASSNAAAIGAGMNELIIDQPVANSQDYQAKNLISASSSVNANLNVRYKSSQIVLKPGFTVTATAGSSFKAYIDPRLTATDGSEKIFTLLQTKQITTDYMTGVVSETNFEYDPVYLLPTSTITTNMLNGVVQGSSKSETFFDNNPTGADSNYYIGRPKKTLSTTWAYNDTFSTEQKYTYTNNQLTQLEKKGNTSNSVYVTEDYVYDTYGNVTKKTISMPGAAPAVTPRVTEYTYDPTGRFVKTTKDVEGLISTNNSYHPLYGMVTSTTNPFNLTTTSSYDNWGKPTQVTDYLGKSLYYTYSRAANGEFTTTKTADDGSTSLSVTDIYGRPIKAGAKNIDGSWSYKNTVYDFKGRKVRESEPYSTTPSLYNTTTYDDYNRITSSTAATGKVTTITYNGLTVTGTDGTKTTSSTKNANGHMTSASDDGGVINYTYYANGNQKTADYGGNIISTEYDEWGNKVKMTDPSAGVYTYIYYPTGDIYQETTPNGTTTYTLDAIGKLTQKTIVGTNTNSKTTYSYDPTSKLPTGSVFEDVLEGKTTSYSYDYDSYKRLVKTTETTPYAVFVKQLAFDAFGRVEKETSTATLGGKSSSKTVKTVYKNGYAYQLLDDATSAVLYQTNTVNARGQLTSASLGNGISIANAYDSYGYLTQMQHKKGTADVMTLGTVFDIKRANLLSRTNSLYNWSESFTYDSLDRLLSWKNAAGNTESQSYDDRGRITQNSTGSYEYNGAKTYQANALRVNANSKPYYEAKPTQDISYNVFKSPYEITEAGVDKLSFTYNDGNDRSMMFYGGLGAKESRQYRKHYSADGSMEVKENRTTGAIEFITYIGGDGYSAPVLYKQTHDATTPPSGVGGLLYLHRDYQGSILAITDATGVVQEKRLFDAWGALIKLTNATVNITDGNFQIGGYALLLDRGYTGHEHLTSVGLIHMNGRLYDPRLHRFLQPDNYVQDTTNTQSYNRYGYCLNNPFKYTDPSGEFFVIFGLSKLLSAVIIGALTSAVIYTATTYFSGGQITLKGFLTAAVTGAISAAVTFGIGDWTSTIKSFATRATMQALAHGTFNGMMSGIQGGKFWSGFASGALSSIASSLWSGGQDLKDVDGKLVPVEGTGMAGIGGDFANKTGGIIGFGTIMGGVGASLTGGNFWQGAATGLFVSGLNHAMHEAFGDEQQQGKQVTKKSLGIKSTDTKEEMISKVLKNMKPGDYISGEQASFLGETAQDFIEKITYNGKGSFSITGKSAYFGTVSAFKDGATLSISTTKSGYRAEIRGLTKTAIIGGAAKVTYITDNIAREYKNGKSYKLD
jgi:RHS repeat-associated protein